MGIFPAKKKLKKYFFCFIFVKEESSENP